MITYVNSVFVSNYTTNELASALNSGAEGQFIVWDFDQNKVADNTSTRFKIGMFTGKNDKQIDHKTGVITNVPNIKWSTFINVNDIKGWTVAEAPTSAVTEDQVFINFGTLDSSLEAKFGEGGKRIIVRLTFKDMPHRYRKWTESYEYVTTEDDDAAKIASKIANMINKEWKRARVNVTVGSILDSTDDSYVAAAGDIAVKGDLVFRADANQAATTGEAIKIEAMAYDDDDSVDSLSWYEKVRFNANIYWTDPAAEGWASLNKNFPKGVTIDKVPGKTHVGYGKLVRDREAQAMGYQGILNRGEGTWPIIKPAMTADINGNYNVITLEYENMYRAADDLFRKTKQTVELYFKAAKSGSPSAFALETKLKALANTVVDKTFE